MFLAHVLMARENSVQSHPEPSVQSFFTGTLKLNLGKIAYYFMLFLPSEEIIGWYFEEMCGSYVHGLVNF